MSGSLTALWLAVAVLFGEVPAEAPQVARGTQVQTPSGDANAVEAETQPAPDSQAAVKPLEPAPEVKTVPVACHVELEGNLGYMNHFDLDRNPNPSAAALGLTRPAVRGLVYDINTSYNFSERSFGGARVTPYVTVGAGAVTALISDAHSVPYTSGGFVFNAERGAYEPTGQSLVLEDKDTFFAVNYGGGLKALNLWGPVGVRMDIRGRTMPNFIGHNAVTWPELTGGVTFSWGER